MTNVLCVAMGRFERMTAMLRLPIFLLLIALLSACAIPGFKQQATAPEPRPLENVVLDDLVANTQVMQTGVQGLTQAWWVPLEFWQVALGRINPLLAQQVQSVLGDYAIVAVVQADVSALGGFVFYPAESLRQRLQLEWQSQDGPVRTLEPVAQPDLAVRELIAQLTPLLGRSMGELGRNLQFFVIDDRDENGARIVDPYRAGRLHIRLAASETQPVAALELEFPLDALFEPRYCANGKPAHVSWRYCPWDGQLL